MKKLLVSFLLMSSSFVFLTPNVYAEVDSNYFNKLETTKIEKDNFSDNYDILSVKKNNDEDEDDYNAEKNYNGLGVSMGYLSASGLSYRTFFANNWGIKATGGAFMKDAKGFGTFGAQGMYVHSENNALRFYSLLGASYFGSNNGTSIYSVPYANYSTQYREKEYSFEQSLEIGAGIGVEIGRKESGVSMALELPVTFIFKNLNKLESIFPIPQISFMYNF